VGTEAAFQIHRTSARPAGSSLTKSTIGSKARLSAIWRRKRKKLLYRADLWVHHYQNSDLKAVGVIGGQFQSRPKPVGVVDLRLRARLHRPSAAASILGRQQDSVISRSADLHFKSAEEIARRPVCTARVRCWPEAGVATLRLGTSAVDVTSDVPVTESEVLQATQK
jgi:hypothetical protein